jgi:hypothetical protein
MPLRFDSLEGEGRQGREHLALLLEQSSARGVKIEGVEKGETAQQNAVSEIGHSRLQVDEGVKSLQASVRWAAAGRRSEGRPKSSNDPETGHRV